MVVADSDFVVVEEFENSLAVVDIDCMAFGELDLWVVEKHEDFQAVEEIVDFLVDRESQVFLVVGDIEFLDVEAQCLEIVVDIDFLEVEV